MTPAEFIASLVLNAIVTVVVLGGATAGLVAFVGYSAARTRIGGLDRSFARGRYRRAGLILLVLGATMVLIMIPGLFTHEGPQPGRWGTALGGAAMVAIGRLLTVRFRRPAD